MPIAKVAKVRFDSGSSKQTGDHIILKNSPRTKKKLGWVQVRKVEFQVLPVLKGTQWLGLMKIFPK